ncbi:MAG: cytochrome c, partial [Gammaproteobacteria bacterium]|nr:cytochrome c [Gammaproteobacteria bacterium]
MKQALFAAAGLLLIGNAPAGATGPEHARGAGLFQRYCARCHGEQAQGAPDWHQRDAGG